MPGAVRYQNPQVQERLAREYVLGTMSAAVRRRFQRLLSADSGLQRQVQHWERHLQPLADQLPALTPPRAVWRALAQRLGHSPQGVAQKAGRGWLGSLRLWRGLTAIAGTAAFALAWLLVQTPEARPPSYLAVLEGGESAASIVATAHKEPWQLTLELVKAPPPASDSALHLWAVSAETGKIQSLGVLGTDAKQQRALSEAEWLLIKGARSLIVTEEAKSGVPPNQPVGPVRYRGLCVQLG